MTIGNGWTLSSGRVPWPGTLAPPQGPFGQLTWLELRILTWKLRSAKRRALHVAAHSGSLPQIWDMIRLINDLAGVTDDLIRTLEHPLPRWPASAARSSQFPIADRSARAPKNRPLPASRMRRPARTVSPSDAVAASLVLAVAELDDGCCPGRRRSRCRCRSSCGRTCSGAP